MVALGRAAASRLHLCRPAPWELTRGKGESLLLLQPSADTEHRAPASPSLHWQAGGWKATLSWFLRPGARDQVRAGWFPRRPLPGLRMAALRCLLPCLSPCTHTLVCVQTSPLQGNTSGWIRASASTPTWPPSLLLVGEPPLTAGPPTCCGRHGASLPGSPLSPVSSLFLRQQPQASPSPRETPCPGPSFFGLSVHPCANTTLPQQSCLESSGCPSCSFSALDGLGFLRSLIYFRFKNFIL